LKEGTEVSSFCAAEHPNSINGCYANPDHTERHWAYSSQVRNTAGEIQNDNGTWIWEWDNVTPAAPAGSVTVVLTREELGILHTLLLPVQHFFPDLTEKLTDARVSL
jgi:hypothetical protein